MEKDKKKTLTISSGFKKKIDTSTIKSLGKKSFSVEKKKPFRPNKQTNRLNPNPSLPDMKKKNYARKFIEKQTTKDLIKKFEKVIKSKKRILFAPPAPPEGLYLAKVIY